MAAEASGRPWIDALTTAEIAINNSPLHHYKVSPFFLNMGFHPLLLHNLWTPATTPVDDLSIGEFVRLLDADWQAAQKILYAQQLEQARFANRHRRAESFSAGDYVSVRVFPLARRSLEPVMHSLGPAGLHRSVFSVN